MDRSERKLRTGKREKSGSGPRWMTLASGRVLCTSGDQGARQLTTRMTSASEMKGSSDQPTFEGWSEAIMLAEAHHWLTGIDQSPASASSAAKPSALPAPRWPMMSGACASDSQRAAISMLAESGPPTLGCMIAGRSSPSAAMFSHSTSRGRLR
jgi:hypothetical protein